MNQVVDLVRALAAAAVDLLGQRRLVGDAVAAKIREAGQLQHRLLGTGLEYKREN